MPTYVYKCQACNKTVEVVHSISECDNMSQSTKEKTMCPYDRDCANKWHEMIGEMPNHDDLKFERVIFAPQIKGSYGGSSLSGAEKRATIKKERKERSHQDFKQNIFPTIPKPEQRFFEKKWKNK
jgi:hypothetical protein